MERTSISRRLNARRFQGLILRPGIADDPLRPVLPIRVLPEADGRAIPRGRERESGRIKGKVRVKREAQETGLHQVSGEHIAE